MFAKEMETSRVLRSFARICRYLRANTLNHKDASIEHLVLTAILLAVSGLAFAAIRRFIARSGPKALQGDGGSVGPSRVLVGLTVLIGTAVGAVALYAFVSKNGGTPALVVGLGAILLSIVSATNFWPIYDISWGAKGISGPTSLWFPPIGPKRKHLEWDRIAGAGQAPNGNWFVVDRDGSKVMWNWVYCGYAHLIDAVTDNCPHLFDDESPDQEA